MDVIFNMSIFKKTVKSLVLFLGALFFSASVLAQNVEFNVSAPQVVEAGEQFRLSYTLNSKGSKFEAPILEGFKILSGPNVSSSSSVQIVNGKMTQSVSYSYNYILVGYEAGKLIITPAKIQVKGKSYSTKATVIEVVKEASTANQNGSSTSSGANKNISGSGNLFASVRVDKKNVYQGEKIIATIKIYTRVDIGGFEEYKFPPYTGFWSQDIESPTQLTLKRENINGAIYNTALLKKTLIVPQRSGELIIDPFTATIQVRERVRSTNPFDDFFGGGHRTKLVKVKSKPVKINVKPLPGNKPADYTGAVGRLKTSSSLDKTEVKANEAITLKIKISGNGNLKFISPPKVDFPPDMDVYDPKTSLNTKASEGGIAGNITFEYLFIPRYPGTFRIAPITFSYFDLASKKYKTLTTQEYQIVVNKGEGNQEMSSGVVQGFTKQDVKLLGKDIRFIHTNFEVKRIQSRIFGSLLFWLVYSISTVLFLIILLVRRSQIKQNANQAKVKNRKANKLSKKRLKIAAKNMKLGNQEEFYDEVLKAIWGYLSDKLAIPVAELSKDNIIDILTKNGVDEMGIKQLTDLLDTCEFARYAPSAVSSKMEDIYKKAGELISKLDQKIKK